jgi:hypothetical protein
MRQDSHVQYAEFIAALQPTLPEGMLSEDGTRQLPQESAAADSILDEGRPDTADGSRNGGKLFNTILDAVSFGPIDHSDGTVAPETGHAVQT